MKQKYSYNRDYSVVAFVHSMFYIDERIRTIKKLISKASDHKVKFVFFSTLTDFSMKAIIDEGEKTIFDEIDVERFDALVLMADTFRNGNDMPLLAAKAKECGVPCFSIDCMLDGCINLSSETPETFRNIVKHMVEFHGYRNIDFIAGFKDNKISNDRIAIFRSVLEENGIPFDESRVFYGDFWEGPTLKIGEQLLERGMDNTDAVICANDTMANTLINFFESHSFRIPEDFAVSGYDGLELSLYTTPRLTTCVYSLDALLDLLMPRLEKGVDNSDFVQDSKIEGSIDIGASCGCDDCNTSRKLAFNQISRLKIKADKLVGYQMGLSDMSSTMANVDNIMDFAYHIGYNILQFDADEIWLCANERFINFYSGSERRKKRREKNIQCVHFDASRNDPENDFDITALEENGFIVPDMDSLFAKHDFLQVLPIHVREKSFGYLATSFDPNRFDYMCCATFIMNLEYVVEIRGEQLETIRTYLYDSLTDLYNRNGFYRNVSAVLHENDYFSVISLDMDGLKTINDTYGHAKGDEALKALGKIIRESTDNELSARIGGDEFLIAFSESKRTKHADEIVARIEQGLQNYNREVDPEFRIEASIGSFTDRSNANSLDYFLKVADSRMYRMKAHHKSHGDISL